MATRVTSEDILEWVRQHGGDFAPDSDGWLHSVFPGKKVRLDVFVKLISEQDYISCVALYPIRVSEDRLIDACELIARINELGVIPHCTINMSSGQIAWTSLLLVEDADFNASQFRRSLFSCVQSAEGWYPALASVLYGGRTPRQAFEEALKGTTPVPGEA
jgi:hypothetical protein